MMGCPSAGVPDTTSPKRLPFQLLPYPPSSKPVHCPLHAPRQLKRGPTPHTLRSAPSHGRQPSCLTRTARAPAGTRPCPCSRWSCRCRAGPAPVVHRSSGVEAPLKGGEATCTVDGGKRRAGVGNARRGNSRSGDARWLQSPQRRRRRTQADRSGRDGVTRKNSQASIVNKKVNTVSFQV